MYANISYPGTVLQLEKLNLSHIYIYLALIFATLLYVVMILCNMMVLLAIACCKELHQPMFILLFNPAGSRTAEEREEMDQMMSPIGSMGKNPTNCYSTWKNGVFLSMDGGDAVDQRRCRKGGVSDAERTDNSSCSSQSNEKQLLRNIEYIANCYRDQRATQKRTGEWKKVAKVLDRFFMWMFFIMVFFMSLLIMGKAI